MHEVPAERRARRPAAAQHAVEVQRAAAFHGTGVAEGGVLPDAVEAQEPAERLDPGPARAVIRQPVARAPLDDVVARHVAGLRLEVLAETRELVVEAPGARRAVELALPHRRADRGPVAVGPRSAGLAEHVVQLLEHDARVGRQHAVESGRRRAVRVGQARQRVPAHVLADARDVEPGRRVARVVGGREVRDARSCPTLPVTLPPAIGSAIWRV